MNTTVQVLHLLKLRLSTIQKKNLCDVHRGILISLSGAMGLLFMV